MSPPSARGRASEARRVPASGRVHEDAQCGLAGALFNIAIDSQLNLTRKIVHTHMSIIKRVEGKAGGAAALPR